MTYLRVNYGIEMASALEADVENESCGKYTFNRVKHFVLEYLRFTHNVFDFLEINAKFFANLNLVRTRREFQSLCCV